jgi:hypothetical protein
MEGIELNVISPLGMTVLGNDSKTTLLGLNTDQSGLIGLLRHLHRRGFVILTVIGQNP